MIKKVCLFGASGHGKVVKDVALSINIKVQAFVDDNPNSEFLHGIPIVLTQEINKYINTDFVISIGNNQIRKTVSKKINSTYTKLIHKTAIISPTVNILEGTVVMAGVKINADTNIGKHVIINTGAIIEHDCIIEDFVHVSPNTTITGGVTVGEGTQIGAGAVIIPYVSIGKWVTIGAGAVILNNIPDYATVVGNPGKITKQQENG